MTDTLNPETARAAFVNAMGAAVTGVHIVTTEGEAGRLGLTVSAVRKSLARADARLSVRG